MDLEKLEKKLDATIDEVKTIQTQCLKLGAQLEGIKGDLITDDNVRMSGQSKWRDNHGHK